MGLIDFVTGRDIVRHQSNVWKEIEKRGLYPQIPRSRLKRQFFFAGFQDFFSRGMEMYFGFLTFDSLLLGRYKEAAIEAGAFLVSLGVACYGDVRRYKLEEKVREDSSEAFILERKQRGSY
jgi:hypothetical protein